MGCQVIHTGMNTPHWLLYSVVVLFLKKNLNAPRPSEHPPGRWKNVKTFRWDHSNSAAPVCPDVLKKSMNASTLNLYDSEHPLIRGKNCQSVKVGT